MAQLTANVVVKLVTRNKERRRTVQFFTIAINGKQ